jgi:NAD(P)-dependent dehydrogenase (short-subunit alcohol dehydrogenase family)
MDGGERVLAFQTQEKERNIYDLSGKVAIVTGSGRPHGLGQGIAKRLAKEGADVVVVDICKPFEVVDGQESPVGRGSWEDLLDRKKEIEALGVRCLPVKCDCTDEQDVDAMVAAVVKEFGHIDILCNNVGGGNPRTGAPSLIDTGAQGWDNSMFINFKTAHLCSRAVAKQMIAQGKGGKILSTASQAAVKPWPGIGMYCAAKAALVMYSKVLAMELAPHKINVNTIGPGTIETDMLKEAFGDLATQSGITYGQLMESLLPTIPLGRLQTPEDVANIAVWLVSPEADYITGVYVLTTGGQTI